MRVDMALRAKRERVVTARMTGTCMVAARLLRSENVDVLVAEDSCGTDGEVILGVLSERAILQAIVDHGTAAFAMSVLASMTHVVVSCLSDDSVDRASGLMNEPDVRHLPVPHEEASVGVISAMDALSGEDCRATRERSFGRTRAGAGLAGCSLQ